MQPVMLDQVAMRANASGSKHIRAVFRHRVRCCANGARRRIPILYTEPRQRPQEPEGGEGGSRERGPEPSMHPPAGPTGECKRRRTTYPLSRFSMHEEPSPTVACVRSTEASSFRLGPSIVFTVHGGTAGGTYGGLHGGMGILPSSLTSALNLNHAC